jgi:hypothetical protein
VSIIGTGTFALQEQTGGTATATNVTATGVAQANAGNAPSYSCEGTGFTLTDGGGNSGITPTQCNGWPAPVYPPYPNSGVTVTPTALNFGSVATGSTSPAQTVTVSNPTGSAAAVSSISSSGDFAQTNNCGSSIAAGASCTVSVTFTPTAGGAASGSLSVASSAPGGPLTVALSGTGVSSTTNLALNRPATASSDYQNYVPSNVTDGNASTYWESTDGAGYPQTITVDLGSAQPIGSLTLDLPPASAWSTRTETLSVLGSTNGSSFSQVVASAGYTFNPSTGNTATISLPSGTSARYVRLSFTGNTGWVAAQLSEVQVYAP